MEILFASKKLQRQCSNQSDCLRSWGEHRGRLIMRRLAELGAMDDLSVADRLPQMACHELKGNRKGQFAVALEHPFRLVFEPADEPPALKDDGGFDWSRIRKIRVLEVVDYHG